MSKRMYTETRKWTELNRKQTDMKSVLIRVFIRALIAGEVLSWVGHQANTS